MKSLFNTNFKIKIQSKEFGKVDTEIFGSKEDLKLGLALLAKILKKESNLTKQDILESIKLGLKDKEELEEELRNELKELFKKLNI